MITTDRTGSGDPVLFFAPGNDANAYSESPSGMGIRRLTRFFAKKIEKQLAAGAGVTCKRKAHLIDKKNVMSYTLRISNEPCVSVVTGSPEAF
jgi:hypothetical protein